MCGVFSVLSLHFSVTTFYTENHSLLGHFLFSVTAASQSSYCHSTGSLLFLNKRATILPLSTIKSKGIFTKDIHCETTTKLFKTFISPDIIFSSCVLQDCSSKATKQKKRVIFIFQNVLLGLMSTHSVYSNQVFSRKRYWSWNFAHFLLFYKHLELALTLLRTATTSQ